MSKIKGKNTKPEVMVRKLLYSMGYRYRLHAKNLPGRPDIVLSRYKKIVEVYGCFWHLHDCKRGISKPESNAAFWESKRMDNHRRDGKNIKELGALGWKVLVIWECEVSSQDKLYSKLKTFLAAS